MKILIIDDEDAVLDLLSMLLRREGYEVVTAADGDSALLEISRIKFDLILLDLMLPDIDGHEVCRKIQAMQDVPIIMITAKGDTIDKVIGLELGADDYITKPFDNRELSARIKALLRRISKKETDRTEKGVVYYSDLEINFLNKRVLKSSKDVNLTPREFQLLEVLAKQPNQVFSREELVEKAWGYDYLGDSRAVDIYITRLRKKIEDTADDSKLLETVYGFGYRFRSE